MLLFLALLFPYVYVHQAKFDSLIPVSRLDLLHSLVIERTFNIDSYHKNTPDKAVFEGHYYCDKAPGVVLMALPAFWLAAQLLATLQIDLDSGLGSFVSSWIACAGSLAPVAAVGGVAMFRWLCTRVAPRIALIATGGFYLGTLGWPYCTFMMASGIVTPLLSISLWAFDRPVISAKVVHERMSLWCGWRDVLGGMACGLALASEYTAGLACIAVALYFWLLRRKMLVFLLGAAVPLLIVPFYHWICFGTPFTLSYSHEAVITEMHEGFFGMHFPPEASTAFRLLFGFQQGLFFWSPFLLLAFLGIREMHRRHPVLFWICYLTPVLQIIAISGYFDPSAGGLFSARHLSPILVFFALPVALACSRFPKLAAGLISLSIILTAIGTMVGAVLPMYLVNPLWHYHLPNLLQGKLCPNIGTTLGLPPAFSLILLAAVVSFFCWRLWRNLPASPPTAIQNFTVR